MPTHNIYQLFFFLCPIVLALKNVTCEWNKIYWDTLIYTRMCALGNIAITGFVRQTGDLVFPFYVWTTSVHSVAPSRSKGISAAHVKKKIYVFERNMLKGNIYSLHGNPQSLPSCWDANSNETVPPYQLHYSWKYKSRVKKSMKNLLLRPVFAKLLILIKKAFSLGVYLLVLEMCLRLWNNINVIQIH